jgi:hypothetical protein
MTSDEPTIDDAPAPVELPAIDPAADDLTDHPDEPLSDEEADAGLRVYRAVDDLDDDSDGLDAL